MAAIAACRAAPTPAPTSAEDAAKKKNTDCVYFLASPLTCKKGAECEFRHSESARINPRDCWFWLAGNCYNRGCPFRHPPLEARSESGAAAAPPTATPATATPSPPQAVSSSKGRVPCYYFAQGYCSKGERCTFLHASPRPAPAPQGEAHKAQQQKLEGAPKPKIEVKSVEPAAAQARATPAQVSKHVLARRPEAPQVNFTRKPEQAQVYPTRKPEQAQVNPTRKPEQPQMNWMPEPVAARKPELTHNAPRQGFVSALSRSEERNSHINYSSRNSSPELESSSHELEDEEIQARSENGGREENSPGFDVLVDDGPDEQLHYMDEGEYHLHGEAGGRLDDELFDYPERFARRGGGGDYERRHHHHDVFDRVDYDRPRHHDQVDNTLELDYYKKSSSIKDRLVFNGGDTRPAAPFLDSGDLRNVLERRKFRGEQRLRNDQPHLHRDQQQQLLQQRRFVQRGPGERRASQERGVGVGVFRVARAEPRRGVSPPPAYERPRGVERSNFAAPKSLAQIRAEKRKPESSPGENGFAKRVQMTPGGGGGGDDHQFEGPKPLQEILKEKQKVVPMPAAVEDQSQGPVSCGSSGANGLAASEMESSLMAELQENDPIQGYDDEEDDDDFAKKLGQFFS